MAAESAVPAEPSFPRQSTANVMHAYISDQAATIGSLAGQVALLDQDAIHKSRVATRRLRSVFGTFRSLLDRDVSDPLRGELKWLAGLLGAVRDGHVLRQVLAQSPELADANGWPAALQRTLDEREQAAARALREGLHSQRYTQLRRLLNDLDTHPLFKPSAAGPAGLRLEPLTRRAARAVLASARLADAPGLPTAERGERRHDVRKAAKQGRYAAELTIPVGGKAARRLVDRLTEVQEVLGRQQDQFMTEQLLNDLVAAGAPSRQLTSRDGAAPASPQDADGADGARLEGAYRKALRQLSRASERRWTAGTTSPADAPG
ncbi:MAG: hypothetical protein PVSMB10_15740 [Pseudarthrobacter sp.]